MRPNHLSYNTTSLPWSYNGQMGATAQSDCKIDFGYSMGICPSLVPAQGITACLRGYYKDTVSSTAACQLCPTGTSTSMARAAVARSDCNVCRPGFGGVVDLANPRCGACTSGFWSSGYKSGGQACEACPKSANFTGKMVSMAVSERSLHRIDKGLLQTGSRGRSCCGLAATCPPATRHLASIVQKCHPHTYKPGDVHPRGVLPRVHHRRWQPPEQPLVGLHPHERLGPGADSGRVGLDNLPDFVQHQLSVPGALWIKRLACCCLGNWPCPMMPTQRHEESLLRTCGTSSRDLLSGPP